MVVHWVGIAAKLLVQAGTRMAMRAAAERARRETSLPPNVERSESGQYRPAPGYRWVTGEEGDYAVQWVTGLEWPGRNLVAGSPAGQWRPAPGYVWVSPEDPASEAVRWAPGSPHGIAPHVVAAAQEGTWAVEPGYRWLNRERGDLRVEPIGGDYSQREPGGPARDSFTAGRLQRIKDLATLGLDEGAEVGAIEAAFRRLVKLHHPDRFTNSGKEAVAAAGQAFLLLRQAYERIRSVRG